LLLRATERGDNLATITAALLRLLERNGPLDFAASEAGALTVGAGVVCRSP
jgi:hypothetical protein